MMKAARYYGPEDVRVEMVPHPGPPGPHEVLLQVEMAALCGTDASQYKAATLIPLAHPHRVSAQQAPLILGHEVVGTIRARGAQVHGLEIGQRVVPGSAWWCGRCEQCLAGRPTICQDAYLYGIHADGGLAEFARYPAKMCVPVPDDCALEAAVMGQACAVALHALERAGVVPGQTVALFGVGALGSLLLAVWRASWPGSPPLSWVAVDLDAARLRVAADLGVTRRVNASQCDPVPALLAITGRAGVDVVIDATGHPAAILQALTIIKRGGTLVQVGIPTGPVPLPLGDLVLAEKHIVTTNGQICQMDLPRALALLSRTDLAARVGSQVIALEDVVTRGLRPLADQRARTKILVKIA